MPKIIKSACLKPQSRIKAGTRINWGGWLKQATVDLWDTEVNDPDHAPDLWVKINYKDGVRVIPDVISAAEAFALDELGWWDGAIYKSLIAANVYTPNAYPQGGNFRNKSRKALF